MLSIHYSTCLRKLADHLLKKLDENPSENLLAPEIFVVQNHGIGQWLSLYMAREQGIAANLEFEFPSERIWSLIRLMDPNIPQTLPSDRGPLTWGLLRMLQDEEVLQKFEKLRHYIGNENPIGQDIRCWQLCTKIADVFDQYLVYRPGMLLDWEKGRRLYPQNEAEEWQYDLWRMLVAQWEKEYDGDWLHRAQLQGELLKAIENDTLDHDMLPDRVTVFGVSAMPPDFIRILVKLSGLIDINFYHLTIDPDVSDPEAFTNPMVKSLGKQGTTFTAALNRYIRENPGISCSVERITSENLVTQEASLFNRLKLDLQQDRAPQKTGTIKGDSSIQVHACHSPRREVEVLYNQLLAVLDENSSIMPDDILIVTPDIETYIPMIEAVFGTADEGQPELPYSIADRGIMGTKPAIQTFLKILSLCQSRFKVTDVLDLLDTSPIQDAFDINDDRLNRLERWIRDNRIRWGIDGDFKKELNMPPGKSYTWISGLDRMVLGYAMKTEDDCLYEDIFPYNEIENSDDALLVGTFTRMMNELFALNKAIQDLKTVREWVKILSNVTENFIPDSRHYFRELSTISNTLEQLKEYAKISGCDDKVPFNIVAAWLEEQLEKHSTGGGRIGRGITFSSFVPMRNIPFKVLGMIGMNDGSFPQVKLPIEFDLMHLEPQAGDPNGSQDDRYLFLESLISTNSHLYFSFVGQSDRQDKDFPPSVILREFIDYLEEYYGVKSEELVTRHRLQAFSPEYFKGEKYFSYSETQKNISRQLSRGGPNPKNFMIEELPDPDEEWKTVLVRDFVSFFQHPAKFLFQKRLGIYMGQDNVITEDREPFELDSLDSYKVGQELLNRYLKNKPLDSYRQILKKRDMIPEGWVGEQAYRVKAQEVREFGRAISQQLDQQPLEDREIDFDINGFRIVGKLANIFETARIKYRFGSMRPKDMIETWIEHLIFQLVRPGQGGYSRYFIWNKDKSQLGEQCLSPLDNVEPVLERLLGLYWKGLKKNTYFFPETSFEFAHEVCYRHKDPEYGFKKASAKWIRDYGYSGECEDPYNKLLLGAENPLDSNLFKETAIDFWGPFFDVLNQGEEVG